MKSHLLVSPEPLKEGQNHKAVCEETVEKAVYVSDDLDLRFHEITRLISCRKCLRANVVKEKYFYAAVPGQNSVTQDGTL